MGDSRRALLTFGFSSKLNEATGVSPDAVATQGAMLTTLVDSDMAVSKLNEADLTPTQRVAQKQEMATKSLAKLDMLRDSSGYRELIQRRNSWRNELSADIGKLVKEHARDGAEVRQHLMSEPEPLRRNAMLKAGIEQGHVAYLAALFGDPVIGRFEGVDRDSAPMAWLKAHDADRAERLGNLEHAAAVLETSYADTKKALQETFDVPEDTRAVIEAANPVLQQGAPAS